ncbi:putative polyketide cyclase [[Actinomadura] parvosata subsp. kistnae]|uniref:MBL fold metallo-hydrolase n=1 Tax=[Actinomadura] parvosata subsp. kistnae TaxID=1909395 RepID=A0A1V0AB90_9ACTN|nr:MBL fold metallo-hydrolase [Nonomuraea sp. ATCC 55076]AQZ67478.1 MBL fold metallo-hydrolase [Nonomuraea sp. ATCC 55076]SPL94267.1 putative polyketide cyclase [Actinomadura parvosata subsp. kistnae]
MMSGIDDAELHELVPGVYAWVQPDWTWWVNNAGAVTGSGGTVVIDTCASERRTRRFLMQLAARTHGAPVRMAVNTHDHGDHTHGNSLLPADTVVVGHESTREGILRDILIDGAPPFWEPVPDWGNVSRRAPSMVFRSEVALYTGERRIELRHPGFVAHSAGDVVAWLPEERVLFAGDLLFNGVAPLAISGSLEGSVRALDWLAAFAPELVVPGHGPLVDARALPYVLAEQERYFRFVQKEAARGLSPLEAARQADLGEFTAWGDPERLVLNLHRAATEGRVDMVAAAADAIAYNGGPLRTTL